MKRASQNLCLLLTALLVLSFPAYTAKKSPEIPINDMIKLAPGNIKAFLQSQYGASAKVQYDKQFQEWEAEMTSYKVSISPYKGKVLDITIDYNPPVPLSTAFAHMGLPEKPPTSVAPAAATWSHVYPGIDEIVAGKPLMHGEVTSNNFFHFVITPNKALYNQWEKEG